ncbi:unnamed protein product [Phytophthora lilii]|uniref:Unnamed protein product n=1 Tax=Phytophthora lilii TaxID=2077276 RepID=A0A9W6WU80_9STRA|nr:unnamed protein product [Phytophthora lilii]
MCGHEDAENEGQNSAASSPRSIKGSLAFILDDEASKRKASTAQLDATQPTAAKRSRTSFATNTISSLLTPTSSVDGENEARHATTTTAPLARKVRGQVVDGVSCCRGANMRGSCFPGKQVLHR